VTIMTVTYIISLSLNQVLIRNTKVKNKIKEKKTKRN